ncbi:hypothetical protein OAO87_01520 [bacterium]|nr:hypothetical protein [bacterium]
MRVASGVRFHAVSARAAAEPSDALGHVRHEIRQIGDQIGRQVEPMVQVRGQLIGGKRVEEGLGLGPVKRSDVELVLRGDGLESPVGGQLVSSQRRGLRGALGIMPDRPRVQPVGGFGERELDDRPPRSWRVDATMAPLGAVQFEELID